jgi:hypothetical protein
MAVTKCPICGSDVVGDVCFTCGFEMRNDAEVAAGHIPEPNPAASQAYGNAPGGYGTEQSGYGNAAGGSFGNAPGGGFTDMPNYGNAPTYGNAPAYNSTPAPKSINTANDYKDAPVQYDNTSFGNIPRVEVIRDQTGYHGNYVPPETDFERFCERYGTLSFSEKFEKYWWFGLLAVLLPAAFSIIPGLVLLCFRNANARKVGLDIFLTGLLSLVVFL